MALEFMLGGGGADAAARELLVRKKDIILKGWLCVVAVLGGVGEHGMRERVGGPKIGWGGVKVRKGVRRLYC